MVLYAPDKLSLHTAAWHGFVGAAVLWKIFGLHDEAVCNAVYHHVQGTSRHPIAMAVFCADKLDPLRGYDSYGLIEACRKDLEAGFALCKEANYKYFMANKEM
jgi:nicotinate-nucleotide adenylyltransferase